MEKHITPNDIPGVTVVAAILIHSREQMTGNTLKDQDRKIAILDAVRIVEEVQAEVWMRQPDEPTDEDKEEGEGEEESTESRPALVENDDDK